MDMSLQDQDELLDDKTGLSRHSAHLAISTAIFSMPIALDPLISTQSPSLRLALRCSHKNCLSPTKIRPESIPWPVAPSATELANLPVAYRAAKPAVAAISPIFLCNSGDSFPSSSISPITKMPRWPSFIF